VTVRDFRDLEVWQKAVDLSALVYQLTRTFPREELFGLTSQLRAAAVSVSSNIAEGNGRGTRKDYVRFLMNAKGSLNEVLSLLAVTQRLGIAQAKETRPVEALSEGVAQMLMALRKSLLKKPKPSRGR
jgi:four helix bundle protein